MDIHALSLYNMHSVIVQPLQTLEVMMSALSVPVQPIDFAWFSEAEGTRPSSINPEAYLSLARYARGNYAVDISPVIREYVILSETNAYGDDVVATVQYNSKGNVSSAGGKLGADGRIVWSCYAD